jgi:hypothetical protein
MWRLLNSRLFLIQFGLELRLLLSILDFNTSDVVTSRLQPPKPNENLEYQFDKPQAGQKTEHDEQVHLAPDVVQNDFERDGWALCYLNKTDELCS